MTDVLFWIALGAVGMGLLLIVADIFDRPAQPPDLSDDLEAVLRVQETTLAARLQMLEEVRRHETDDRTRR